MTNQVTPPVGEPSDPTVQDWWARRVAIAPNAPRQAPRNDVRFGVTYGINRGRIPGTQAIISTVILNDFSGGGGLLQGPFSAFPNRYYQGVAVDASNPGYLLPSQLWSATGNKGAPGTTMGLHGLNIFGTLIFGLGSTNDICLWKETSATDPTPTAITGAGTAGRPGSSITGIWPVIMGGATSAVNAIIGRSGAVPMTMTDANGTVSGTALDAAWNPTWWVCQTSLPGNPILHQSGNSIYNSLTSASAINAVPTASTALSGTIRAGGFLIGEYKLADGSPPRVYFVHPKVNTTGGMLGSETLGYVEHIPLDGIGDLQRLNYAIFPNGIYQAMAVQSPKGTVIVAHDGRHIAYHDGTAETNMRLVEQLAANTALNSLTPINSAVTFQIRSIGHKAGAVYADINTTNSSDVGQITRYRYDWDNGTWHRLSAAQATSTNTAAELFSGWGGFPVSNNTGFAFTEVAQIAIGTNFNFTYQYLTTADENPYLLYRRTTGAGSSTGNQYEAGTTSTGLLSPIWTIDGLEGIPFVCAGITFGGDLWSANASTDGVYVAVYGDIRGTAFVGGTTTGDLERGLSQAAGIGHSFLVGNEGFGMPTTLGSDKFEGNEAWATRLQVQIAPILTSGVRYAPNCLPVYLHLIFFLDGKVMTPRQVRELSQKAGTK